MKMKITLSLLLAAAALNCVGWQSQVIPAPDSVPRLATKTSQPIVVNVKTTLEGNAAPIGMQDGKHLKEAVTKYFTEAGMNFSVTEDAVSTGYLVTYNWDRKDTSPGIASVLTFFTYLTLGVIPSWGSYEMNTTVRVYKGSALLKEYKYAPSQKEINQILLLFGMPFARPDMATQKIADNIAKKSVSDILGEVQFK